jgi:hypothetical protein
MLGRLRLWLITLLRAVPAEDNRAQFDGLLAVIRAYQERLMEARSRAVAAELAAQTGTTRLVLSQPGYRAKGGKA